MPDCLSNLISITGLQDRHFLYFTNEEVKVRKVNLLRSQAANGRGGSGPRTDLSQKSVLFRCKRRPSWEGSEAQLT